MGKSMLSLRGSPQAIAMANTVVLEYLLETLIQKNVLTTEEVQSLLFDAEQDAGAEHVNAGGQRLDNRNEMSTIINMLKSTLA